MVTDRSPGLVVAAPRGPQRRVALAVAGILALTGVAYAGTLRAGFVWDDTTVVLPLAARPVGVALRQAWATGVSVEGVSLGYYRPLVGVSFAMDGWVWGARPAGLHLTNLVLYLGCVALAYPLARRMLGTREAALMAAAFFGLHPVHIEAVAWLQGRADLLAFGAVAAALVGFLRVLDQGHSLPLLGGIGLAFLAGLLSKESALVAPGLAVACWALRPRRPPLARAAWALTPFLLALALYAWLRAGAEGGGAVPAPDLLDPVERLLLTPIVFAKYVGLLVWPYPLNAYYLVPVPASATDPRVLAGAGVLLGALAATAWAMGRAPRLGLAFLWVLVGCLPVLPLAPVRGFTMAERYLFLPSFGLALAISLAAEPLRRRPARTPARRAALGAGLAVTAAWIAVIMARVPDWVEQTRFYRAMVRTSPDSAFAHNNLGQLLVAEGSLEEGIQHLERAVALRADMAYAHAGLGLAHWRQGDLPRATAALATAARLRPHDPRILRDLATALTAQGQRGEAARVVRRLEALAGQSDARVPRDPAGPALGRPVRGAPSPALHGERPPPPIPPRGSASP